MKKYSKIIGLILVFIFVMLFSVSCKQDNKKYTITYTNGDEVVEEFVVTAGSEHTFLEPLDLVEDGYYCSGWKMHEYGDKVSGSIVVKRNLELMPFLETICTYDYYSGSVDGIKDGFVEKLNKYSNEDSEVAKMYRDATEHMILGTAENGYGVTRVASYAFENIPLDKIVLPKSIRDIGVGAFQNCGLKSIDLSNVQYIGAFAFAKNKLTDLVLPETLKKLGDNAFADIAVNEIVLPDSLEIIDSDIFSGGKIIKLTLGKKLKYVSDDSFKNMKYLLDLYNLSSIDSSKLVFSNANNLSIHESLDEEETFIKYNDYVFKNNELVCYLGNDKVLELPETNEINNYKLGDYLFYDDDNIEKVTVPGFVKEIPLYSFYDCALLKEVVL